MASTRTLGEQIDDLYSLRETRRDLEASIKKINAVMEERERELLDALAANGDLIGARGGLASVSVQEIVVPQVEDWDTFYAFIRRHNKFELLHRRISSEAFRELAAQRRDKTVPGLVPFTKRSISLKKV